MLWRFAIVLLVCGTAVLCSFLIGGRYTLATASSAGNRASVYRLDRFTGATYHCVGDICIDAQEASQPPAR
jgi:hypothetical protein